MDETITERTGRPRRRRRGLLIAVGVVVVYLAIGSIRAPAAARDYFATAHGAGATVTNVEVTGAIPLIPPFWGVSIDGDVKEAGPNGGGYLSAMLLCLEPITGFVIVCGSG